MSGVKKTTVKLSEAEYQRLHQAEMRLRFSEKQTPKLVEQARQQESGALWDQFSRMQSCQDGLINLLGQYDSQLQSVQTQSQQALLQQQADLFSALEQSEEETADRTNALLHQQQAWFASQMETERSAWQQALGSMQSQLDQNWEDEAQRQEYASQWVQLSTEVAGYIQQFYPWRKFAPAEFPRWIQELNLAEQNLSLGFAEAALASAQTLYLRFSNLRLELEQKMSEWQAFYYAVQREMRQLQLTLEENKHLPAFDLKGNPLPEKIEIDYWSGRKLSRLSEQINNFLQHLDRNRRVITTLELRQILETNLPQMKEALDRLISDARLAALNSQLRINIADLVVQALASQGFSLQDSTYDNNDQRKGYGVVVSNLEGCQVMVQVEPTLGDAGQNELTMVSYDAAQRTEHELQQRARELTSALNQQGLSVGAMRTDPADAPPLQQPFRVPAQIKENKSAYLGKSR